jgi:hypothetical protein
MVLFEGFILSRVDQLLIITGTIILGLGYLIIEFLNNLDINNKSTRIMMSMMKNQDLDFDCISYFLLAATAAIKAAAT